MKRVDVFKRTNDDWYPAYLCEGAIGQSGNTTGAVVSGTYRWR